MIYGALSPMLRRQARGVLLRNVHQVALRSQGQLVRSPLCANSLSIRTLCAKPTQQAAPEVEETQIVLTPAQKVKAAGSAAVNLGILGLVISCGYFIARELFPSRMNPNGLFSEALDLVKGDPEVANLLGSDIKGYGMDRGGHREGRRNFVENVMIPDPNGGKSRLRIRFNVEGTYGHAYVFAEAREGSSRGEWVYLMVQSTKSGAVVILHDNRNQLLEDDNESGGMKDVLKNLIGGGEGSK